jgi:hypothetical protein
MSFMLYNLSDWEMTEASSIAIWNKKNIVIAIATGVWVTNIAFLVQG